MSRPGPRLLSTVLLLTAAGACPAADPGYYVVVPYDDTGVTTVELRHWTVRADGRAEVVWPEVAVAYGVNSRWTTSLLTSWIGPSDLRTHVSAVDWRNVVLLTQGELDVDVGVYGALSRRFDRRPAWDVQWGPMLQTEFGRTRANLNLLLDREVDGGGDRRTRLSYQWQLRRRWQPGLAYGLQGFGEVGPWRNWLAADRQSHRAGPMIAWQQATDAGGSLGLDLAVLRGKTFGRTGRMVSVRGIWRF